MWDQNNSEACKLVQEFMGRMDDCGDDFNPSVTPGSWRSQPTCGTRISPGCGWSVAGLGSLIGRDTTRRRGNSQTGTGGRREGIGWEARRCTMGLAGFARPIAQDGLKPPREFAVGTAIGARDMRQGEPAGAQDGDSLTAIT